MYVTDAMLIGATQEITPSPNRKTQFKQTLRLEF